MFQKLFAESGLSLDRLKALLEAGAAGSIAKAARGDPVRQSQYSRQIKELENFFQTKLVTETRKRHSPKRSRKRAGPYLALFPAGLIELPAWMCIRGRNVSNRRRRTTP